MGASLPLEPPRRMGQIAVMRDIETGSGSVRAGLVILLLTAAGSARATVYELSSADAVLFGREERVVTSYEDTLYEIARRYSLGSEEMVRVNPGMDPWLPGAGKSIVIPG